MIDELEPLAAAGGLVLDWHTCDAFPERWVDLVIVLQCDHTQLWDRLEKRYVIPHVTLSVAVAQNFSQELSVEENPGKQYL